MYNKYNSSYHKNQSNKSYVYGKEIIPFLKESFSINSVIDIGSGICGFLKAANEFDIEDVIGVDGDYVNPNDLLVKKENFIPYNLENKLNLKRKFDLVVSLETAEHIDKKFAQTFIDTITSLGNLVLFSAAQIGQGGVNHVNCQSLQYWEDLFNLFNFEKHSNIVYEFTKDKEHISQWYRKNAVLYKKKKTLKKIDIELPEIEIEDFGRRPTHKNDIAALFYLIDSCKGNILEIGTWYGKTTYELAKRFPSKTIYTIDYMEDDLILREIEYKTRANKDDLCKYAKHLPNVEFIYENSETYDFNNLKNVDFIFIDGNHSFEGVKIDSEKSIDYLNKNNGGIISWHDIKTGNITEVPEYMYHIDKSYMIYSINNSNIGFMKI